MEFSEPIVLHLKRSILDKYLVEKLKKYALKMFAEVAIREIERKNKEF
jgi:hypothetical protein